MYAQLMKDIWCGKYNVVIPHYFKSVISQFNNNLRGYNQHDAFELLMIVLDCLHEDLNRVFFKPHVPTVNNSGTDAEERFAIETWRIFILRNESCIVDHFYGLLQSRISCRHCHNSHGCELFTFLCSIFTFICGCRRDFVRMFSYVNIRKKLINHSTILHIVQAAKNCWYI